MQNHVLTILLGVVAGTLARLVMLRSDYRHYPSYPHGFVTHISLGFIAALVGAVAVPALAKPDYAAATFLILAAQQFREIRNMERETLARIEQTKLVQRGSDYIEGIAGVFEARNYLVIITALATSGANHLWGWPVALGVAVISLVISHLLMQGECVGDIADVVPGKVHFDRSLLMVGDVVIMNVGLPAFREKVLEEGRGVVLKPRDDDARLTLDSIGQRQAILHDISVILGTKIDEKEMEFMPLAKKNADTGEIGIFLLPNEPDLECLVEIIKKVPVIESSKARPLSSYYGRRAAD
ncbi:MAG: YIEGIA family protein [Syntrophothermaceae bacterium]|jgi:uncharacterized membrane protein YeaQ/YmgE (transglycosylase-associated protein family)